MPEPAAGPKKDDPKTLGERVLDKAKDKAGDAALDWVLRWLLPIAIAAVAGGAAGAATSRIAPAVLVNTPSVAPLQTVPVMAAGSARLAVRSTPPGGRVTLDGRIVGQTPVARLDVDPGAHAVVVDLTGYAPYLGSVQLPAGGQSSVDAVLVPESEPPEPVTPAAPVRVPRAFAPPRRDCDGEGDNCRRHCDDAAFSCRASCQYCGGCVTSMTQEQCQSICSNCRQGCEQNERFCTSGCESQESSCRASLSR